MWYECLLEDQRMDAVGRFAGGVAHDFNNLIAVIEGFCDLALERCAAGEDPRQELDEIRQAVGNAAAFTSNLLALSGRQLLRPMVLDPGALLAGLRGTMERLLGRGIDVRIGGTAGSWKILADRDTIERALTNLAARARAAMPRGGTLAISTANVVLTEEDAREHPVLSPGEYVIMRVSDTGRALDRETQTHVFEPYFATREGRKGAGLGLSAARRIIRQNGGHIHCSSEADGTTFEIYLPRVKEDRPVEESNLPVAGHVLLR